VEIRYERKYFSCNFKDKKRELSYDIIRDSLPDTKKNNDGRYWPNSGRSTSIDGQNSYYLIKIKTKSKLL
jgi:hypothetical protein